jgi:Polyketide cyclase / dehydrase and lipid transport
VTTYLENVIRIELSREEVFAFLGDLENMPFWDPAIEVIWKTSPSSVGVGTTYRQIRSAPERSEQVLEVTTFDPPRRLIVDGEIGPFRARIGFALEAAAEATRLTNWVELDPPSIISRVEVPLAASQIKAAVASNLELLKRILEDTRHTA